MFGQPEKYPKKADDITRPEVMAKAVTKARSLILKDEILGDRDMTTHPITDKEQGVIDIRLKHLEPKILALAKKIYPEVARQERLKYQLNMKKNPIKIDESAQVILEGQFFDLIYLYQFIKRLVTPFKKTKAYKLGIIDGKGNVLIKRKDLTKIEQRDAYTLYDTMIFNLKKLLALIPGGKTTMGSLAAGLLLLKEENNRDFLILQENNQKYLEDKFNDMFSMVMEQKHLYEEPLSILRPLMTEARLDTEDMTTSALPTLQEPIVSPEAARKYKKKNKKNPPVGRRVGAIQIGEGDDDPIDKNIERHGDFVVFIVDVDTFNAAKLGKKRFDRYSKYVGTTDLGEQIRQYGRQNPKMPVILKDEKSGQLCFLKYGSIAANQIRNYYNKDQNK